LIQKTARQLSHSVQAPPRRGPRARKIWLIPTYAPMALPRTLSGKAAITIVAVTGIISAAPIPWATRAAISQLSPRWPMGARPQSAEARKNTPTPARNVVTGPSFEPSLPPRATNAAIART
jgi:hypothetical protein